MDPIPPPSPPPPSSSPANKTMSEEERQLHISFMREALSMASLALATNETPVGCVFVHEDRIIGRGMNATNATYNGTRHAEFVAINDILSQPLLSNGEEGEEEEEEGESRSGSGSGSGSGRKKYGPEVLRECDLYVTVEPCIMCASLLRQFGVRKVFFGAGNEKFGGCGGVLSIHVANGAAVFEDDGNEGETESEERRKRHEDDYEVSGGWLREEAILLLRRFYVQENGRAPEPRRRGKEGRALKVEDLEVVSLGERKGAGG